MNWRKFGCIVLAVHIVHSGCTKNDSEYEQTYSLEFDVVDSLLSPQIFDIQEGICYRIPAGWRRIPDSLFALTDSLAEISRKHIPVNFRGAYSDKEAATFMTVFTLTPNDTTFARDVLKGYKEQFLKETEGAQAYTTSFFTKNFLVYQLLAQTRERVAFRLLFWSERLQSLVEFDFVIPRDYYGAVLKKIESVIGSVSVCTTIHN